MINNEQKELLSTYDTATKALDSSVESRKLVSGSLGSSDSVDYTLRFWLDESVTLADDAQNKVFNSKIVVTAVPSNYSPKAVGYDTLRDAILANEYQTTPEKAIEKIEAKGTPDISLPAPVSENDLSDKGLYEGTDDYGTTYYYRGKVSNNNVYFAGFYWQIVRINGDGSIRLIYNGSEKNATGVNRSINNRAYQFNNSYNDPAYVGYMYGDPDATTFAEVHANTNDSTIKSVVDGWYKTNIADKGYIAYVSNAVGFCGDRTIYSGGNGIQTNKDTYFGAYGRFSKNAAQFTCPEPYRDLYTVSDSNIGNKALTYSVGLITYDEMVFAGMTNKESNKLSWIYSEQYTWTMSPSYFSATRSTAYEWGEDSSGLLIHWWGVRGSLDTRPVINLKADVKISGGIGTVNEPFIIETN